MQGFTFNASLVDNGDKSEFGIHYNDTDGVDIGFDMDGNSSEDIVSEGLHKFLNEYVGKVLTNDISSLDEAEEEEKEDEPTCKNDEDGSFSCWEDEKESLLDTLYKLSKENNELYKQQRADYNEIVYWKDQYMKSENKFNDYVQRLKKHQKRKKDIYSQIFGNN